MRMTQQGWDGWHGERCMVATHVQTSQGMTMEKDELNTIWTPNVDMISHEFKLRSIIIIAIDI